ncbi:hypothetical protein GCM10008171_32430 [Methylopila jiangsuensis]|uniref:Uncharacterized protein n=1 Tax=Methylopila jiangsuensis TaxID=586230 RepID=A0A9W6JLN4_9HYPH|nr:hypothetical protein [Methylopila jiangsuensis]MDR6284622.1 hypothetical protein [Methylopila jiangsuensis]GLK77989.1 hypothetical protein GCM10008171_32430 [Methylopila jiangsuensis]
MTDSPHLTPIPEPRRSELIAHAQRLADGYTLAQGPVRPASAPQPGHELRDQSQREREVRR